MLQAALWNPPRSPVEKARPPWKELGLQGVVAPFLLARGLWGGRGLQSGAGHALVWLQSFPIPASRVQGARSISPVPMGRALPIDLGYPAADSGALPLIQLTLPLIRGPCHRSSGHPTVRTLMEVDGRLQEDAPRGES